MMYYEEQIINGKLYFRSAPDGDWRIVHAMPHSAAVAELLKLTDEQRLSAFHLFCVHCGKTDPRCQCWND